MSILLFVSAISFLLSLLSRIFIESSLHTRIPLLGNFVALQFTENPGIAFGITFHPVFQAALVVCALLFVCFLSYQHRRELLPNIAFGMILGGALANIFDRLDDGLVTDFIAVGSFPTFNVPDSLITIGVGVLLLWEWMRGRAKGDKESVCIAVVGMNGVGKSNFSKKLASELAFKRIDTDTVFRETYSNEPDFIEKHGWEEYRKRERDIVLAALKPGFVVVLGGGAIESQEVRQALKKKAKVLWLQAGAERVAKHLAEAKRQRPEFSPALQTKSVEQLLEARNPLYREVADVTLFEHVPFRRQIQVACGLLKAKKKGD
jgi:lipoprotein signal peptidase